MNLYPFELNGNKFIELFRENDGNVDNLSKCASGNLNECVSGTIDSHMTARELFFVQTEIFYIQLIQIALS